MKQPPRAGLIIEGNTTKSALLRLPGMGDEIGPIKSVALRVARRAANFLRAGYAVADYPELEGPKLILIRVPDASVERIVEELMRSTLDLRGLSFVLCETWLTSNVLEPLRASGASVASLIAISGSKHGCFVVEGQRPALRQIRKLLDTAGGRGLEIRPGAKSLFFAATLLATALPVPLLATAQRALRTAGIEGNNLRAVMDEMAHGMVSGFLKGGRAPWGGPLTETAEAISNDHLKQLREEQPEIAVIVNDQLALARETLARTML